MCVVLRRAFGTHLILQRSLQRTQQLVLVRAGRRGRGRGGGLHSNARQRAERRGDVKERGHAPTAHQRPSAPVPRRAAAAAGARSPRRRAGRARPRRKHRGRRRGQPRPRAATRAARRGWRARAPGMMRAAGAGGACVSRESWASGGPAAGARRCPGRTLLDRRSAALGVAAPRSCCHLASMRAVQRGAGATEAGHAAIDARTRGRAEVSSSDSSVLRRRTESTTRRRVSSQRRIAWRGATQCHTDWRPSHAAARGRARRASRLPDCTV